MTSPADGPARQGGALEDPPAGDGGVLAGPGEAAAPFEETASAPEVGEGLHPLLHTPLRLQICAGLCAVDEAEFAVLRAVGGVSDSVLSKHLAQLEADGLIRLRKAPARGRVRTWVGLTAEGRRAATEHLEALTRLAAASRASLAARSA